MQLACRSVRDRAQNVFGRSGESLCGHFGDHTVGSLCCHQLGHLEATLWSTLGHFAFPCGVAWWAPSGVILLLTRLSSPGSTWGHLGVAPWVTIVGNFVIFGFHFVRQLSSHG